MGIVKLIKIGWNLVLCTWYLILITGIAYILFAVNDQGKDFIYNVFLNKDSGYLFVSIVFLVFWCFITWYSCSVVLYDFTDRKRINIDPKYKRVFGRTVGLLPLLVIFVAVLTNPLIKGDMEKRLVIIAFLCILAVVLYLVFASLTKQKSSDYYPLYSKEYALQYQAPVLEKKYFISRLKFIRENKGIAIYFKWYGSFFMFIIFLFLFKKVNYTVSELLKPPVIVILALSMFTYIATVINIFHHNRKLPVIHLMILCLYLFSYKNDNGLPNPLLNKDPDHTGKRDSLLPFFKKWVQVKLAEWKDSTKPMPIFLIANQGGGTRGSAWSSLVLQKLDSMYNQQGFNFFNQIFVMSGASGGGVGGNFYSAVKFNQQHIPQQLLLDLWQKDHLTSLTASLSFSEPLASFFPFSVPAMEGTKMLEYSWARSFREIVHPAKFDLDQSFLSMWYKPGVSPYQMPSVFINGVMAETGQKIIASNLILDTLFLGKNLDYHAITGKDVRYNTAMTFCSRFPVLTAESLVRDKKGKDVGHILDGGLLENTATTSLFFLIDRVLPFMDSINAPKKKIEIVILYVQNSGVSEMPVGKSNSVFRILSNPIQALLNTSGIGVEQDNKTRMLEAYIKNDRALKYFNIRLGRDTISYPLGLYMSKAVLQQMQRRVNAFTQKDTALYHYLENYKNQ